MPTIVLDADATRLNNETDKSGKKIKGLVKNASEIGDQFTKAIAKVELFKRAVEAVGRAASETINKASESNKRLGGLSVSMATSFASMGVSNIQGAINRTLDERGTTTVEERSGFVRSLGDTLGDKDSRVRMSETDIGRTVSAFNRGGSIMFGEGGKELIDDIKRGYSVDQAIARSRNKRPGLSELAGDPNSDVTQELALRSIETADQLSADRNRAQNGRQVRAGASTVDRARSTSVSLEANGTLMDQVPILGDAATLKVGASVGIDRVHKAIEKQTMFMRDANRPSPAIGTQGEGGR